MKKKVLLSVAVAALMILGTAVQAQPGSCDGPMGQGIHQNGGHGGKFGQGGPGQRGDGMGHLLRMADELELTKDQIAKIEKLQTGFRLQMVDARADLEKARIELQSLKRDEASESTVFAAIDQLSEKQAELKKMAYGHRQQVHAVLTSEQLDKLKEQRFDRSQCGQRGGRGQWFDNDNDDARPRQGSRQGR